MVGEKKMDKKIILLLLIGVVYSSTTDKIDVGITMVKGMPFGQNSVGLLEISLHLKNLNTKTIKYMTLEIDAYNRVGDLITPYPGTNSCKVTPARLSITNLNIQGVAQHIIVVWYQR